MALNAAPAPCLRIGDLVLDSPAILAPMAGYTDSAFRRICRRYHSGLSYTEVVTADGLARGSGRTLHMLETSEDEKPVAGHMYGPNPETMAQAAAILQDTGYFSHIDINCGCPVRKIVAKGAGAALLKTPERIHDLVKAVRGAIRLPVTVKTRIGYFEGQTVIYEIAAALREAGVAALAIHGRYAVNQHRGPADWETIAEVKRRNPGLVVIGNGGIQTADDALRLLRETGVDGVMIGRGAVGNPWIFDEIYRRLNHLPFAPHDLDEHERVILEHLDSLTECKSGEPRRRRRTVPVEFGAALQFRAHLMRYVLHMRGAAELRRDLQSLHSADEVRERVRRIIDQARRDPRRESDGALPLDEDLVDEEA